MRQQTSEEGEIETVVQDLGIQVAISDNARLANNTKMPADIGGSIVSPVVIFAQPGSPGLLGVVVPETAHLRMDPRMRTLIHLNGPDMLAAKESQELYSQE